MVLFCFVFHPGEWKNTFFWRVGGAEKVAFRTPYICPGTKIPVFCPRAENGTFHTRECFLWPRRSFARNFHTASTARPQKKTSQKKKRCVKNFRASVAHDTALLVSRTQEPTKKIEHEENLDIS